MNAPKFIVALTGDFYDGAGAPKYRDIGLSLFADHPRIEYRVFPEHRPEIGPDQVGEAQGVIVLSSTVTARSVSLYRSSMVIG